MLFSSTPDRQWRDVSYRLVRHLTKQSFDDNLPFAGSIFRYSRWIPLAGRQESTVEYLPGRKVKIDMSGVMQASGVVVPYRLDEDHNMVYTLPREVEQRMQSLYTTFVHSAFDPDTDTVRVTVKPPIIPQLTMVHNRVS
jgi:hypothetical protein